MDHKVVEMSRLSRRASSGVVKEKKRYRLSTSPTNRFTGKSARLITANNAHFYSAAEVAKAAEKFKQSFAGYNEARAQAEDAVTTEYFIAVEALLVQAKAYKQAAKLDASAYDVECFNVDLIGELKVAMVEYNKLFKQSVDLQNRLGITTKLLVSESEKIKRFNQAHKKYRQKNGRDMYDVIVAFETRLFSLEDKLAIGFEKYNEAFESLNNRIPPKACSSGDMYQARLQRERELIQQEYQKEYGPLQESYNNTLAELNSKPEFVFVESWREGINQVNELKQEHAEQTKKIQEFYSEHEDTIISTKDLLQAWKGGLASSGQELFDTKMCAFMAHIQAQSQRDAIFNLGSRGAAFSRY
jgi:hypothetical protein